MKKKLSASHDRNKFLKISYLENCNKNGIIPDSDYLDFLKESDDAFKSRFDDPESRESDLEYDLLTTDWILEKARQSETYSQNLYAALCNNDFIKNEVWDILKGKQWACSWRRAGGIIADMRQEGDYINWYSSGIMGIDDAEYEAKGYLQEGTVSDEIRADLKTLGWCVK